MTEMNGQKFYTEDEVEGLVDQRVKYKRRESDRIIGDTLLSLNGTLETFGKQMQGYSNQMVELTVNLRDVTLHLNKHDAIIHGNGREGMITCLSKTVSSVEAVCRDVWDKDKGLPAINAKLDVIMERKKDYDKNLVDVEKLRIEDLHAIRADIGRVKGRINTITAVWGAVAGICGFIVGKVADGFIANMFKGKG